MLCVTTWFEIPSPFETAPGSVLLADPPVTAIRKLKVMLLDETYPKPYVIDDGESLTLYFNLRLIQSVMRLESPDTLELRYTRKMMSFLLFDPEPERIGLIGMGGGSLVRFCHRYLPDAHLTAVECDPDVLAFRDIFRVPPEGPRLKIIQADGAEYLARTRKTFDVLLVDAFDKGGVAPALASRDFFETAFTRLSAKGQFIINLAGDKRRFRGLIEEVTEVFGGRAVTIPVQGDGNAVLMAFKAPRRVHGWRHLHVRAKVLKEKYNLDFSRYASIIESAMKN